MRIVFNKISGAVLAAVELLNGDTVINPTAVQAYPFFNGFLHDSFTKDTGNPADLSSNARNYVVDTLPVPTSVIPKFHIEIVLSTQTMTADGINFQSVTVNIKDSANVLQNVVRTIDLSCNGGFLPTSQVATSGGTATFNFIAPNLTTQASIIGLDDNVDNSNPACPVYGTIPGISPNIDFISTPAVQGPLASVMESSKLLRTMAIMFNDGDYVLSGMKNISQLGNMAGNSGSQTVTFFADTGVVGAEAGFKSTSYTQIDGSALVAAFFDYTIASGPPPHFMTWLGMASANPGASANPTHTFGFRYESGVDVNWKAYCNDGTATQVIDTGIAVAPIGQYDLEIKYDHITRVMRFFIGGNQRAQMTLNPSFDLMQVGLVAYVHNIDGAGNTDTRWGLIQIQYN